MENPSAMLVHQMGLHGGFILLIQLLWTSFGGMKPP
jgi:hypothetical protein